MGGVMINYMQQLQLLDDMLFSLLYKSYKQETCCLWLNIMINTFTELRKLLRTVVNICVNKINKYSTIYVLDSDCTIVLLRFYYRFSQFLFILGI